jgi:hypothetical protein
MAKSDRWDIPGKDLTDIERETQANAVRELRAALIKAHGTLAALAEAHAAGDAATVAAGLENLRGPDSLLILTGQALEAYKVREL